MRILASVAFRLPLIWGLSLVPRLITSQAARNRNRTFALGELEEQKIEKPPRVANHRKNVAAKMIRYEGEVQFVALLPEATCARGCFYVEPVGHAKAKLTVGRYSMSTALQIRLFLVSRAVVVFNLFLIPVFIAER
jgi:hypothetical protein